jgi:DNA-directed RNA polymerase subunit N (RpoN/RPB10)
MKLPIKFLAFIPLACFSCTKVAQTNFDENAEKANIMKVIEAETDCFFKRDYDCWQDQFTHTDYSYQAWSNADGTFDASVGWNTIEKNLGKYIKENPQEKEEAGSSHPKVLRKNIKVKFYGNEAAHLTWDQYNSDRTNSYFLQSKEVRLMEKINGKWKIVNVSAFWNYKNKIAENAI